MSYSAYTKTQNRTTEAPRDIEYRLLGAVTAALLDAEVNNQVIKRVEAVCWNRDVWVALRMDLTHPQNNLPDSIKKDLVDLASWIDKETFNILSGNTNKLDGLIEVNKNIMTGLSPRAAMPATDATAPLPG